MSGKPKFIVFDKRMTLAQSAVCDLCTFAPLALLVWISMGSRWWTFFAGCLALMWVLARFASATSRRLTFTSTDELRAWVDEQDKATP